MKIVSDSEIPYSNWKDNGRNQNTQTRIRANLNMELNSNCSHKSRVPLIRIEFHASVLEQSQFEQQLELL